MARLIFDISREIEIARAPDALFDKITQFERIGALAARSDRVNITRLKGEGPPAPGHVWRIKGRALARERQGKVRLTELERPRAIGFTGAGGGFETETAIRIVAQGGGALFSVSTKLHASGFKARLAAPYLRLRRSRIEAAMDRGLARLKAWAEAEAAT